VRFTLIKDLKKDRSMKPILMGLLLFMLLYLLADFFVKSASIGLLSDAVTLTLIGNVDEYLDPIAEASFLEHLHTETFFLMLLLLTLSAVFIRLNSTRKFSLTLLNTTMLSALLSLISLAMAYYISLSFVTLYVITFFLWHIGALLMTLLSLWSFTFE